MIDHIVEDLTERWELTSKDGEDLKLAIASYAWAAICDEAVRREVMEICQVELGD